MPTIMRFLGFLVLIAALAGAAIYFLGNFVTPNLRPMTVRVPPSRLDPKPVAESLPVTRPVAVTAEPAEQPEDAPVEESDQ